MYQRTSGVFRTSLSQAQFDGVEAILSEICHDTGTQMQALGRVLTRITHKANYQKPDY